MADAGPVLAPMITQAALLQFAPKAANAAVQAAALEAARLSSTVNTPQRLCHFMGQIFVESAGLCRMEESFAYHDPARLCGLFKNVKDTADAQALMAQGPQAIANRVYANRLGNGPESSGDGWLFRGSGYIQLTGRANYQTFGNKIGMDLVSNPNQVRDPGTSAVVAFAFWDAANCSELADSGDVEGITRCINGAAEAGLQDRRDATAHAMTVWPVS